MYYREGHYHERHHHRLHISTAIAALSTALGGIIVLILGIRFVLSALQVDRLAEPASFIYSLSYPFVAPFFGLFNYQQQLGVVRFEYQTVVAIAFWALVTWILAWLISSTAKEEI